MSRQQSMNWAQIGRSDGWDRARMQLMEPRAPLSANALASEALGSLLRRIGQTGNVTRLDCPLDIAEACAYLTEFQYGYLTRWNAALSEATT